MPRWNVGCDTCDASAWIGNAPGGIDAWCEACQRGARVTSSMQAKCANCGQPLTTGEPRFIEIYGELQHLAAVLSSWEGNAAPLAALLPERPRFLSDRNPPSSEPGDSVALRAGVAALASGDFAEAVRRLEEAAPGADPPRRLRALAIALERRGDLAGAERVLQNIRGAGEDIALRLQRGALRARRGDWANAGEDFARAGDGHEARWNRAALEVYQAVGTSGAPDAARVAAARRAAGTPSSAWSDHTVGRLLWALLIERELARTAQDSGAPRGAPETTVLRAAEAEFEFATFWDRAAVIEGYARLGAAAEVARLAPPLAAELVRALELQPALTNGGEIATALGAAKSAIAAGRTHDALAVVTRLLERPDLARYRVPCVACGRGTVGVAEFREDAAAESDDDLGGVAAPPADQAGAPRDPESAAPPADRAGGRLQLEITGMHCAACVTRVEQALASVENVTSASVNLATERAAVRTAGPVPFERLTAALRRRGLRRTRGAGRRGVLGRGPRARPPCADAPPDVLDRAGRASVVTRSIRRVAAAERDSAKRPVSASARARDAGAMVGGLAVRAAARGVRCAAAVPI